MDAERDALVALYRATGGDTWGKKQGWCTDAPLSEWYGVKVSDGRVVELNLMQNNLQGWIPKGLGQLRALEKLDLYFNQLKGSIPKELGLLSALNWLDLSYNNLAGSIPKELGQLLGALTIVRLSYNNLRGSIPRELGHLGALKKLYLYNNKLEGSIPEELGQLGALESLNLSQNRLKGSIPKELGQLGALEFLNLSENYLQGSIPKELGLLGTLEYLNLSQNRLKGSMPNELGELGALTILHLDDNMLKVLPLDIAVAFSNIELWPWRNPWKEPPSDVVGQGLDAGIRYWKDTESYGRRFSNRMKVVLVGLGSAGKTSLAIRLEGRDGDSLPGEDERTVGVEIRDIHLKPSPVSHPQHSGQDLAVKLWDFAGQRAYYDTHQVFLTQDALYILVVDVSTYRVEYTPEEAMEQWIDIIQSRAPGAIVLLVGTHKDVLPNADVRAECMKELHQDVEDCNSRLRNELEARRPSDLNKRSDQVVRVVNGHNVFLLDCKTSGEADINRLRSFIATVAYNRDYSFPTVESQIPTPWVYAFLTLEAIRRGADLRGVSGKITAVQDRLEHGDPKTAKYFVFFDDALVLFKNLWKAMGIEDTLERAGEVFLIAIELMEAQGWILLTNRDGSVDDKCDGQVNQSHLVLHVDPVRFADVVRRIVDIRLVDSRNNSKIMGALSRFVRETKGIRLAELSRQHARFYMAGEVSKNYLKFLWLHRKMDLGQATKEAPPLEMTEGDVQAMVGSLVDLRMMFPVRKDSGDILPDRYIVGACLPDHVGCEVTVESILELNVRSAMFRLVLQIDGSRNMPPGLIPRLLAWCGRGEGRITACWRRGGCFTYKEHLVLIYECRISERQSSIVCCAKGDPNTETAGGILEDVANEVDSLIHDSRYGFPGIELCRDGDMKKFEASGDDLKKLLQRLEEDLEDHMNLRFDELEWRSERIADDVNAYLHAELGAFERRLGISLEGIERKIDFAAALAGKCLLLSSKDDCPCPRLIWTEEDIPSTAQPQSGQRFGHFRGKRWLKRRKTSSTRFRVRFLCAHDYSLVACGADGNGYVLEQKDWQRWLQKCLPVLQLSLWVLRLGVSFIARADLLPMDDMLVTLKEIVGEDVVSKMSALDLRRASDGLETMQSNLDKQVQVYGNAYKDLVEFVEKEEEKMAETTRIVGGTTTSGNPSDIASPIARNITSRGGQGHLARQPTAESSVPTCKRSFEEDMVYVNRVARSTGEVEFAWVHKNNKKAWEAAVG